VNRLALPALLIIALGVVGCTGPSSASPSGTLAPSPTASPAPTPTPTPTPEPEAAGSIVVRAGGFDIVGESGTVLFRHDWPDEVAPAVAELSEVFESEPAVGERQGDNTHFPDYRLYEWSGFELRDAVDLQRPRDEYFASSGVDIDVAAVNGIDLVTESGLRVGSTFDEVAAAGYVDKFVNGESTSFLLSDEDGSQLAARGPTALGELQSMNAPFAWYL
jgi:hypothetical protein